MGNPMGPATLISELVSGELAAWIGLKVPPFAIVDHCQIDLTMVKNGARMAPPMFFSRAVDGTPHDGGDTFLSRLREPGDVALLVIFDTWVRNWDRFFDGQGNADNLLYVKAEGRRKYDLVPIDHSSCFIGDDVDFPKGPAPKSWVLDPKIYGKFPAFDPYIDAKSVKRALQRLSQLERNFVLEVVNSIPAQWGLGLDAANSLADLICGRAEYVVNTISARLVDEPEIPGLVK
ncbi:HipA family kinase [Mesorhizobium sp. NBSH29]|uniref:HipA family kinase n=1 Tax=Mesorhizobium sp. NBSH29 TaxID=2654249 RepID=UPI0035BBFD4C